ncbi:MAG: biotin--[acetyl-CoA-carboxylase] ligase [Pseudomonadota bacterium]
MDDAWTQSFAVLRQLSAEAFRSGAEISRHLNVSRASVHNLVERARSLGVAIHAVPGRGYRLAEPCSWLTAEAVRADLPAGYRLALEEVCDSTNSRLLAQAASGAAHKTVLAAEWQTGGRGRRGRTWLAAPGAGLTFSLLWRFNRPLTALSGLSLAIGVALAEALEASGARDLGLKWPNDVLARGAKLAGILIETQGDMLSHATAVIGVGLNVRAAPSLPDAATIALSDLIATEVDRNRLLARILASLDRVLEDFDRHGFAPWRESWQGRHVWQGRPVRVLGGTEPVEGIALGVDTAGVLLIETATGVQPIHAGEVSLRPGAVA